MSFNECIRRRASSLLSLNISTRNSSPPQRNSISSARTSERTARATARIALSPTLCPSVSLIGFKLSMSMTATHPSTSDSVPPWSRLSSEWKAWRLSASVNGSMWAISSSWPCARKSFLFVASTSRRTPSSSTIIVPKPSKISRIKSKMDVYCKYDPGTVIPQRPLRAPKTGK